MFSPIFCKVLKKCALTWTPKRKAFSLYLGAFILDAVYMCEVDQVTFVSTGKSVAAKCFFRSTYGTGRNVFTGAGMVDQIMSLNFNIVNIRCVKTDNTTLDRKSVV